MTRGALVLVTLCLAALAPRTPALAQEPPESTLSAVAICDGLLSADASQRDRCSLELNLINPRRAEELGREIQRRPVVEARQILGSVGEATGSNAVIAAVLVLESDQAETRRAAFEAMVEAPIDAVRRAGPSHLKGKRRANLQAMLASQDALKPLCESVPESNDLPRPSAQFGMRLAIMADCHYGSAGFLALLRTLGELMIGTEPAAPADEPDPAKAQERLKEARAQTTRLCRQAAAVLESIWLAAPGAQFNYVANAPIEERRAAVARLNARLDEMAVREVELTEGKAKGVRLGDYMIGLFGSDVNETVAAVYLRLQWWRGDKVPIEGEDYGGQVERINALGRRERTALRGELRRWWETYRKETEQKS
ncbi:MAG: hypothetical protein KF754_13725 [Planctomycetes bacterium]|nr:hypothetical protein [Planctomycetota bacterium]